MRTTPDRIRHAVSFEVNALLLVIPVGGWLFGLRVQEIGIVAIVSSTIATIWNYIYNLGFDHAMLRLCGDVRKTVKVRVVHAVLFEAGLLFILVPFIAIYLDVSWTRAFVMDISFSGFYLVYAFVFNWAYDVVFPVPGTERQAARVAQADAE